MSRRKNLRTLLTTLAAILIANSAIAQNGSVSTTYHASKLDSLILCNERTNANQATLEGYRIQIYSGSGVSAKQEAFAAQTKFLESFPNEKVYLAFNAPFWRVRVGDYRFRSEALPLLNRVKRQFTGSYLVRDNAIRKQEFK